MANARRPIGMDATGVPTAKGSTCDRLVQLLCHVSRSCPHRQPLQPSGQDFELLVCAQFVQTVNADLNRLGVVVGNSVDVFGTGHGALQPHS
jgi:hypothetical protein